MSLLSPLLSQLLRLPTLCQSLSRENMLFCDSFVRKRGTSATADILYNKAISLNTAQGEIPNFDYEDGRRQKEKFVTKIKDQIKSLLRVDKEEIWKNHVKSLTQQGHFLSLAAAEYEDAVWKSYMYDLKQGTMKFLMNAAIDTLPTTANLFKWKKTTSNKCKLCKSIQTTRHILNICKFSLENGKFLWRHNNIVNYVLQCLDQTKFTIYSDLPGHTVGAGSIPPEICITTQKPDIVIKSRGFSTFSS